MTDYAHEQWNKAVQNGNGYVRMGGNPGTQFININRLTPEQIERANNIEQNGYFIPAKDVPDNRIHRDATKGYNGLQKFFGKILGDQEWMDKYYPTGGAAPINYEALANHIQETEYEDPRINTEGMDYQIPGPQGDYFVQPKVAINNGIEELVTRAKKENDDQHRHRLMQDNIKDMKFIQQNPNWFLNPLIDAQIKDRYRYMKDQGLI